MANTEALALHYPRTDTYYQQSGTEESGVVVAATASATAEPDGDTAYVSTGQVDTVRLLVSYTGTVTSAALRLWLLQDGVWYRASGIDLNPADGNESYDARELGAFTKFTVQVESVDGGGTIEVRALGVR